MPISLETLRLPARRLPSMSTITMPDGRGETVSQLLCRPSGTRLCSTLLPSTDVPGFPVSPLRGWSNTAVHFFAALGVATQTRGARRSSPSSWSHPSNPIISSMLVSDFHYDLPPDRIAQEPLADRAGSRLLHMSRLND